MITADTLLNHLRDSRPVRYGAMAAIGVTAGDADSDSTKALLKSFGSGASNCI